MLVRQNYRYSKIDPGTFQVGDIVEVTATFVVLPIKGDRYILIPQLKVLTLLDRLPVVSHTYHNQLIETEHSQVTNPQPSDILSRKSSGPLKRRRLYVTEDSEEDARRKMGKMNIDGEQ
jgi:hypothetical protein